MQPVETLQLIAFLTCLDLVQVSAREYCFHETFTAKCGENEVILMTEALYGRMNKQSRCIDRDYGYIPCVTDALVVADFMCSGKQQCSISVPNDQMDDRKTCPKDLITYLHASYKCVKAVNIKPSCKGQTLVPISSQKGLLTSSIANSTGCGLPLSPYVIKVGQGQRLNFTLHDFSYIEAQSSISRSIIYAALKDKDAEKPQRIHGTNVRTSKGFLSETNEVKVIMFASAEGRNFALEFEAIGCADPPSPSHGWLRRLDDTTVLLGCNDTASKEWKLVCSKNQWIAEGEKFNCTQAVTSASSEWSSVTSLMTVNIELALALIVGIAFVIAAFVILVGIIFIRRNYHRHSMPPQTPENRWPRSLQHHPGYVGQPGSQQDPTGKYSGSIRSQENEYASIQESTYGTNGRSKYIPINACSQGIPGGGTGGMPRTGPMSTTAQPDLVCNDSLKEVDAGQCPEGKTKCRMTAALVNNNSGKVAGQKQYFVVNTVEASDVIHDERAYSY